MKARKAKYFEVRRQQCLFHIGVSFFSAQACITVVSYRFGNQVRKVGVASSKNGWVESVLT